MRLAQVATAASVMQQPSSADMARVLRVLRVLVIAPVADGHNDLSWRIREDTLHPSDVRAYDQRTCGPSAATVELIDRVPKRRP